MTAQPALVDAFIARWQGREGGQERANYALFLAELCDVLGVRRPDPTLTGGALRQTEEAQATGPKPSFPASELEQAVAVMAMLNAATEALSATALAARFRQ